MSRFLPDRPIKRLSPWSQSAAKRFFDCACVLLALPLLAPVLLAVALAVRLTSSGPVFFLQKRMGRQGRTFTILKFRTMVHDADQSRHAVTTAGSKCLTPVGAFLRRWKLDELPQLLNVLCRAHEPGGSPSQDAGAYEVQAPVPSGESPGAATIAFAREEAILARVPKRHLDRCYHTVILPAKRKLDREYMARATFLSDFKLLVDTVLRRWDSSVMEDLLDAVPFNAKTGTELSGTSGASVVEYIPPHMPIPHSLDHSVSAEQLSAS